VLLQRRARLRPREIGLLFAAVSIGALVIGALTVANTRWSAILPGGGRFYSIWSAGREFLFQPGDPYGLPAAARAQSLASRDFFNSTANLLRLDLPFFLLPLYFPFALISDPVIARGVWATVAELALAGSTIICVRLVEWNPPRLSWPAICIIVFLGYPALSALVEGSPVVILMLIYCSILWALKNGNDELAGGLAALVLYRWEVGLPLLLMLAASTAREGRWRTWAGFAMTFTILVAVSFMIFPGWIMPFLVGTVAMLRSPHGLNTQAALAQLGPASATGVSIALTAVTIGLLLMEFLGARTSNFRRFAWAASLALAATPLLGIKSDLSNLVMLVPGLLMIAAGGQHRRSYGGLLTLLLLVVIVAAPWVVLSTILVAPLPEAKALVFLLLPLACVLGMYWTRWWFLRPPRTWLDQIRAPR
jgi:hypothetical protein